MGQMLKLKLVIQMLVFRVFCLVFISWTGCQEMLTVF